MFIKESNNRDFAERKRNAELKVQRRLFRPKLKGLQELPVKKELRKYKDESSLFVVSNKSPHKKFKRRQCVRPSILLLHIYDGARANLSRGIKRMARHKSNYSRFRVPVSRLIKSYSASC